MKVLFLFLTRILAWDHAGTTTSKSTMHTTKSHDLPAKPGCLTLGNGIICFTCRNATSKSLLWNRHRRCSIHDYFAVSGAFLLNVDHLSSRTHRCLVQWLVIPSRLLTCCRSSNHICKWPYWNLVIEPWKSNWISLCLPYQDNSIQFEDLWFVETLPPIGGCMGGWMGGWVDGWGHVKSLNIE